MAKQRESLLRRLSRGGEHLRAEARALTPHARTVDFHDSWISATRVFNGLGCKHIAILAFHRIGTRSSEFVETMAMQKQAFAFAE
jgi:hypothetical protein